MKNTPSQSRMTGWRQTLHSRPEFGFETDQTAAFVVERLQEFGIKDIASSIGGTGIVATIRHGSSNRSIALRADMDALRIQEQNSLPYRSATPGLMHACGHDGHTAILLGAAEALAKSQDFDGTIRLIFQPAEEWGKGAQAMIDDGLMERFPFEEIWGFHNIPGLPIGQFETRPGPITSAEDIFEITLKGLGGHASKPQSGRETLVPACALVMQLQTIISRRIDPAETAVVSITELLSDGTRNALSGTTRILGDVRSFSSDVSKQIEQEMRLMAAGISKANGLKFEFQYSREFIPGFNNPDLATHALKIASSLFGSSKTNIAKEPMTGSEDFARFTEQVPGCYVFLGNGIDSAPLHNPNYDFNDQGLKYGADFLVELVKNRLPIQKI